MQTPLERELCQARWQTDNLFRLVHSEALYERPIPERHRIVFYLGHLEAFDWNLLARYALGRPSFHPTFDELFAFGIDPGEGDLPSDLPADWPSVAEVESYNRRIRDSVDALVKTVPGEMLEAAIEHRLMHAETLAYIIHQLPYDQKTAMPVRAVQSRASSQSMVRFPYSTVKLGRQRGQGFGWDNEYEAQSVELPGFAIGKYKVTNGEYLEFVREGGDVPFFWQWRGGQWHHRGMFEEVPLPLSWPVYVTKCQAEAYAHWRRAELPTEAQYQRAAAGATPSQNIDFRFWDPIPVTADDDYATGPAQLVGNGWEWTNSVFSPLPGFTPQPYYQNYSEPFFDGRHYVLKGGSPRTAARLLRPSFRNWFRPSYPYIYATFRLVES
jgi:formylglycine-generating enzyme required for sulfatase activity